MVAQVSLKRIGGQGRALHGVDMSDNSRLVKLRGPTVPYLLRMLAIVLAVVIALCGLAEPCLTLVKCFC
ncbi:hypothetical protein QQP08_013942 [Theobroma cacao]|nr:hypothetical protein QQP08_013942 [Theobroma cacao]